MEMDIQVLQLVGVAMLPKVLLAFMLCIIVILSTGNVNAELAIRQPNTLRTKKANERQQHSPTLELRTKQPSRAQAKSLGTQKSKASSSKYQSSSQVANPRLAKKVQGVLDWYYTHPLNTRDDAPWSVLHWSIAYGVDAKVLAGGPNGQMVTAIGWLCCNRPAAGKRLVSQRSGNLVLPIAPGVQGHEGQFLSMLAQSKISSGYVLRVGGQELKIADLVEHEKKTCRSGTELTFKLIGLSHFMPSDEPWQNARGETWSVQRLLQEELKEPINRMDACCGGMHRLFALSYAVNRRRKEGRSVTGPWKLADRRVRAYQRRVFQLQNNDGSFSTLWLESRENRSDKTRNLITSGHQLEWLAFSLPDNRLHDPKFEHAVAYVANLLEQNRDLHWHRGGLGHALHALALYEQRVLGASPGERVQRLARRK